MDIQLIQGEFSSSDSLELITRMIHAKINYHESKINSNANEEDIKYREDKIKRLQKDLFELRTRIHSKKGNVRISSQISVD